MIDVKYFDQLYSICPVTVACDLCEGSLEGALIQHKFLLDDRTEYILVCSRNAVEFLLKFTIGGMFRISVEIQDNLKDEWYLVCPQTKLIIYSPGA